MYSDFDASGTFRDNGTTSVSPISVFISHRALLGCLRLTENTSSLNIQSTIQVEEHCPIYMPVCLQTGISLSLNNKCSVDSLRKMGYAWSTDVSGLYAGMKLLSSGPFNNTLLINITGNGGLDLSDGFSNTEKIFRPFNLPKGWRNFSNYGK